MEDKEQNQEDPTGAGGVEQDEQTTSAPADGADEPGDAPADADPPIIVSG